MFERFRDNFFNFINSRLIVLTLVVLLMGGRSDSQGFRPADCQRGKLPERIFPEDQKGTLHSQLPGQDFRPGTASFLPTMILLTP